MTDLDETCVEHDVDEAVFGFMNKLCKFFCAFITEVFIVIQAKQIKHLFEQINTWLFL